MFIESSKTVLYCHSTHHFYSSAIDVYNPCVSSHAPHNLLGFWIHLSTLCVKPRRSLFWIFQTLITIFIMQLAIISKACVNIWAELIQSSNTSVTLSIYSENWCNKLKKLLFFLIPNYLFSSVFCCIHVNQFHWILKHNDLSGLLVK